MSSLGPVIQNEQQLERRSRLLWGGLIVGFFLVHGCILIVGIVLATCDPTHAVIPNYHQQAMEHDKVLAERQASERLGWKWTVTQDAGGVVVQLSDAQGRPVENSIMSIDLYHHARGNQHRRIKLQPVADQPGRYRGDVKINRTGVWQIDLDVQRGAEHFIDRREKYWSQS
jgi:nitrogen fixation protein FixH